MSDDKATITEEDSGPPKWLTASFVESAIRKDLAVNSLQVENAVAVGENYATIVYRTTADTTLGPMSFIVKCMPQGEFRKKLIEDGQYMTREIRMYEITLPLLSCSSLRLTYPRCLHIEKDGTFETIVLQDLRPFGFRTSPRQLGLDVAHSRLAITELAHLHGLSAALRIQQPDIFRTELLDNYKEMMYVEENREKSEKFVNSMLTSIADSVRVNLPFRFHGINEIIEKLGETAFNDIQNDVNEVYVPENEGKLEDRVIVLNHGDFWSNNMLFQYKEDSETPVACAMIDFQLARVASPSLDLFYFLYSSTTQATRRAHMDELLQLYFDEATLALRVKGIKDPGRKFYKSVAEIKEDMQRHINFGFLFSCVVLSVVIADQSTAPDLDEWTEEDLMVNNTNPFAKMYSGPRFVSRFTELLEDFDDMGFFKNRANLTDCK